MQLKTILPQKGQSQEMADQACKYMCPTLSRLIAAELRVLCEVWYSSSETSPAASTAPASRPSAAHFPLLIGLHPLDWGSRG